MTLRRVLVVLAAVCVVAAIVKLQPLLRDFDTVEVRFDAAARPDTPGKRFDDALLANLDHFAYIRSFDRVFTAGPRRVDVRRPLWFDRCEVRQGDFYRFLQWLPFQGGLDDVAPGQPDGWQHDTDTRDHVVSGRLDAPANGLTFYDAWAYCGAAGGRLPSGDEWIAAAVGPEGRRYPWGDDFDPAPWPYLDPLLNATRPCGEHPNADTPSGISELGHNVSEWAVGPGTRPVPLVMGGNGYNAPRDLYALGVLNRRAPAGYRSPYLGFRCVYDARPSDTPWRTEAEAVVLAVGEYPVGVPDDARVPGLLAHIPRDRLPMIRRLFAGEDRPASRVVHLTAREITRREYAAFLGDPFVGAGLHAEANQPRGHSHRPADWEAQMRDPDLPVINVDWWSAYAFASWAGGRLPTAEEWEGAASGGGRRIYPWGNDWRAWVNTVPVDHMARKLRVVSPDDQDATPEGLLAMGGNVSEWTRSVSGASGRYSVVVKGGNYLLPVDETARMDFRNHVAPNHRSPTLGFRVAFDRSR